MHAPAVRRGPPFPSCRSRRRCEGRAHVVRREVDESGDYAAKCGARGRCWRRTSVRAHVLRCAHRKRTALHTAARCSAHASIPPVNIIRPVGPGRVGPRSVRGSLISVISKVPRGKQRRCRESATWQTCGGQARASVVPAMFTRGARLPSSVSALARGRRRARCTLAEASRFDSLFATPLWRANLSQTGALDARDARALVSSVRRAFRSSEGLLHRYAAQGPAALAGAANNEFLLTRGNKAGYGARPAGMPERRGRYNPPRPGCAFLWRTAPLCHLTGDPTAAPPRRRRSGSAALSRRRRRRRRTCCPASGGRCSCCLARAGWASRPSRRSSPSRSPRKGLRSAVLTSSHLPVILKRVRGTLWLIYSSGVLYGMAGGASRPRYMRAVHTAPARAERRGGDANKGALITTG